MCHPRRLAFFILAAACVPPVAHAQFGEAEVETGKGVRYGPESVHRYQAGVIAEAVLGSCTQLYMTVPVPTPWPEQQIRIIDEEFSPAVFKVAYRSSHPGLNQMLIYIPRLPMGQTAKAVVTFEVTRRPILPPEDTSIFEKPIKLDPRLRTYLATGIHIEPKNGRIRALAKKLTADKATVWEEVEAFYRYVCDNVEHRTTDDRKGAADTLRDGYGGNNDITALFIALCRAHGVPARTVWVAGYCYAEFYLHDDEGNGHWFPCQVAGSQQFGEHAGLGTIMQKGDNFQVEEKSERMPYVREFVNGKGSQPKATFIRQTVGG